MTSLGKCVVAAPADGRFQSGPWIDVDNKVSDVARQTKEFAAASGTSAETI